MTNVSIVIISFNAERKLQKVLERAISLSDDVILVDSGSIDKTKQIASNFPITWKENEWMGYGKQKNLGNQHAKYDWILSLDADEVLSMDLINEIKNLELDPNKVYSLPFTNIYCNKVIKFGRWRNEKHVRLFNKKKISWNEDAVHEGLNYKENQIQKLSNPVLHYSMDSKEEHIKKARKYAIMGAERLHKIGKKASFIKLYINPTFRFLKDYFFTLGILDGKEGFQIASIIAKETYWKYRNLKELNKSKPNNK